MLLSAGLAAGWPLTAQAVAVSADATVASPLAVDVKSVSGDVFQEYAYARAVAGYGFGKIVAYAAVDWTVQPSDAAGVRNSSASARASYAAC